MNEIEQLEVKTKTEVNEPKQYQVVLINDDYTPMDFVVELLMMFFGYAREQAIGLMLEVHTKGKGVCGIFHYQIAEMKVAEVNGYSRAHDHPLLCRMEEIGQP